MGVDERRSESALYSLDCQFTSKLSQPSNQPGTFEKAAALAAECLLQHINRQSGCETYQMKVHVVQTHTELSSSDTVPLI